MNKSIDKKTEALKLALHHIEAGAHNRRYIRHVIREALAEESSGTEQPRGEATLAQQDIPDLIAGAIGVSRGTAYDLMREALAAVPEAHKQPAQQEPKPKFVRNVDGVPCITLVEHEHLMRSRSKPAQPQSAERGEPKVLMQEIARLHDRIKDLEWDVEFLSRPAQRKPWRGLTDKDLAGCDDEEFKQARYWEQVLREKNT